MQKLKLEEAEKILKREEELWQDMKKQKDQDHRIHVEFAHFSRLDFFDIFEKYAVKNADSLGMNEQELILLLDFWNGELEDINQARESKPNFYEILDQIKEFFMVIKQKHYPLSRIHLHPYGSFFLCYDKTKWADGKDAIIKSALTTPKYCVMQDTLEASIENFDIPEIPLSILHPINNGEMIWTEKENLTYQFDLFEDSHENGLENIRCYFQFFLKCRTMVKTAGMGDTISSTGFIYHAPIPNV